MRVADERDRGGVSITAIVKHAGLSRTTFYAYFPSGEQALLAAVQESLSGFHGAARPARQPRGGHAERLRAALGALLEYCERHPDIAGFTIAFLLDPQSPEPRPRTLALLQRAVEDCAHGKGAGAPPAMTAEVIVAGALAAVHARLSAGLPLADLLNPLMWTILQPYQGPASAARELSHAVPARAVLPASEVLANAGVRLTPRTVRVLAAIAAHPGATNVQVARSAGVTDEPQMSKLLRRMQERGLVVNEGLKGNRNAWSLTPSGRDLDVAITQLAGDGG